MPVFETNSLDAEFEGQALLAALLHPTRAERTRALVQGRRRAKLGSMRAEPTGLDALAPVAPNAMTPSAISLP